MAIRLLPKRLIGQTIRLIRNRLGQTQDEFARSLGYEDGSTVSGWETGESQPDAGTLARIATMGVVDVLVFSDTAEAEDVPQLTPGEAQELNGILLRMETLLSEARQIVDRASNRTALEALEAAVGPGAALPKPAAGDGLALSATVSVEARPRRRSTSESGPGSGSGNGRGGAAKRSRSTGEGAGASKSGGARKSSGARKSGGASRSSGAAKSGGQRRSGARSSSGEGSSSDSSSGSGSGSQSSSQS